MASSLISDGGNSADPITSQFEICLLQTFIYTGFQCYVHRRHLRSCFDMLFKRLFNCERAIFHVISGRNDKYMIITDPTWLKKIVNITFPDLRDN